MTDEQAAPPGGVEHRRSPRYPIPTTTAAISVVGARLVNVSAFGALIESPVPMESDAVMPLRLVVAGEKVDIEARVAQCAAAAGERRRVYRIGLEFLTLPASVRDRLIEVLRGAAEGAPPEGA